jgi:hypothetical protein
MRQQHLADAGGNRGHEYALDKTGRAAAGKAAAAKVPGLWPAGLKAGLLYAELGYALRASAGPARTQARPAAPAGGPQAGQPGSIRQQLGDATGAWDGYDRPDPAAGQRQPLPRSVCRGIVWHATHDHYFAPFMTGRLPNAEASLADRMAAGVLMGA